MEYLVKKVYASIALLLVILTVPAQAFAGQKIRISTGEWPPYISKSLKHKGVVAHIVTEAFAVEDTKVDYRFYPWKRAMRVAKKGTFQASIIWGITPEREKDFYYSDPVMSKKLVFFHLKEFPFDWKNLDDLKGIPTGGTNGYWYKKLLEEKGKLAVQWVPSDEMNLKKILKGRIKIVPIELGAGYAMIQKGFTPEQQQLFTHHPKPLKKRQYNYLIVSKQIKDGRSLIKSFNKGLKHLQKSGKFDQYYAASQRGEYNLKQYPPLSSVGWRKGSAVPIVDRN